MTRKIALITGASRGLGAAFALELASRGWHVVAVARTVGGLEELDDRIKANRQPGGGDATLAPMDVTNDDAMRHLCLSVHDRWGRADLWIHTAVHAAPLAPAGHIDTRDWEKSIATNVRATGTLIPMVEPLLRAAPARHGAVPRRLRARARSSSGATAPPRPRRSPLPEAGRPRRCAPARAIRIETPAPMPTATRARFFPGEDRAKLADPRAEAARMVAGLHLTVA